MNGTQPKVGMAVEFIVVCAGPAHGLARLGQLEADGLLTDRRRLADLMAAAADDRALDDERATIVQQHLLLPAGAAGERQPGAGAQARRREHEKDHVDESRLHGDLLRQADKCCRLSRFFIISRGG